MKVINGNRAFMSPVEKAQYDRRRKLLAIIHIAKKDLHLLDEHYRAILHGFQVESARDLTLLQLEKLAKHLKHLGWKPLKRKSEKPDHAPSAAQLKALRDRALWMASEMKLGEGRFRGLLLKICGVEMLEWCRDVHGLERFLKVLTEIRAK